MNKFVRFDYGMINLHNITIFYTNNDDKLTFKFDNGKGIELTYENKEKLKEDFSRIIEFLDNDKQFLDLTK